VRPALDKRTADQFGDEDLALVERAQTGDREALGELFMRHAQTVRRLLASVVGSSNELDDLTQEVFIQVFRSLPSFRRESRFTTWLHQVTLYAAYNHLRRPQRMILTENPEPLQRPGDGELEPHTRLHDRETMARLNDILASIKPKKRIAFILFAVEGYSVNEISEMVKAPIPTVKSRIWFARHEVRRKARRDPHLNAVLAELGTVDDEA
jgi:RNA polymerase sigma-70 factor, ECF subfamily